MSKDARTSPKLAYSPICKTFLNSSSLSLSSTSPTTAAPPLARFPALQPALVPSVALRSREAAPSIVGRLGNAGLWERRGLSAELPVLFTCGVTTSCDGGTSSDAHASGGDGGRMNARSRAAAALRLATVVVTFVAGATARIRARSCAPLWLSGASLRETYTEHCVRSQGRNAGGGERDGARGRTHWPRARARWRGTQRTMTPSSTLCRAHRA